MGVEDSNLSKKKKKRSRTKFNYESKNLVNLRIHEEAREK